MVLADIEILKNCLLAALWLLLKLQTTVHQINLCSLKIARHLKIARRRRRRRRRRHDVDVDMTVDNQHRRRRRRRRRRLHRRRRRRRLSANLASKAEARVSAILPFESSERWRRCRR